MTASDSHSRARPQPPYTILSPVEIQVFQSVLGKVFQSVLGQVLGSVLGPI